MFEQSPHFHFKQLESTNNYASTIAKLPETKSGTAITADFQVEGRGQRDNKWLAEPGSSFLGTLILKPKINAEDIFYLSKWSALIVAKTLVQLEVKNVQIKWPNDIYVEGKKIGGILIENSWSDQLLHYSLLGIGINFSNSPLNHATCLSKHIANTPTVEYFLNVLRQQMSTHLALLEEKQFAEIDLQYHNNLFQINETHTYRVPAENSSFEGKIIRVEADGKLIIEKDDQSVLGFYMKEIIFI